MPTTELTIQPLTAQEFYDRYIAPIFTDAAHERLVEAQNLMLMNALPDNPIFNPPATSGSDRP